MYREGNVPPVSEGEMETFLIAVKGARDGKVRCFPADYLNSFPLWTTPPLCLMSAKKRFPLVKVDGCNATGWFERLYDEVNDAIVSPLYMNPGDQIVAWCPVDELCPVSLGATDPQAATE